MSLKEKGQYAVAFTVVGVMLLLVGFPAFLLAFFGAIGFLIWRLLTAESRSDTRRIFEFYLAASEILRQDERRWFGFEINEAIARGEGIVKSMPTAPPLIHFTLGALYHKIGDYSLADKHLSFVAGEKTADELSVVFPTKELRDYARVLRKIERSPAEAPLTSAAVRALERARKNRLNLLLEECRVRLAEAARVPAALAPAAPSPEEAREGGRSPRKSVLESLKEIDYDERPESKTEAVAENGKSSSQRKDPRKARKTISEVLHDIYDANA